MEDELERICIHDCETCLDKWGDAVPCLDGQDLPGFDSEEP